MSGCCQHNNDPCCFLRVGNSFAKYVSTDFSKERCIKELVNMIDNITTYQ